MIPAALVLMLLAAPQSPASGGECDALRGEIGAMRRQLLAQELQLQKRDEQMAGLARDLQALGQDVGGLRERMVPPVAGPFLSGPPASSDSLGVAKTAVFAPRVEVESPRPHDNVTLRVRRLEIAGTRVVAEVELGRDVNSVDLPLDQNGALYVVEWSTSEGHSYNLVLRDGASGQTAASVPVKPLQGQGRFAFVGYRLE